MHFFTTYKVMAGQIDVSNHVGNVQFYELFKSGVFEFLYKNKFAELVKPKDLWPVVLSESCEFHHEILFNEEVKIEVFFSDIGPHNNKYVCNGILYSQAGIKAATWRSFQGILNRETRKIEPLPAPALELILAYTDR